MRLHDITCISDLYYVCGRWFTLGMVVVAFVTMPFALEKSDTIFAFLMCSSIAFVGVAAEYRDRFEGRVHYVSAMTSAICSLPFVLTVNPQCLCLYALSLVGLIDKKRWLLWCEVACFVAAYTAIVV